MDGITVNGYLISFDESGNYTIDGKRVKPEYNDLIKIVEAIRSFDPKTSNYILEQLSRERTEKEIIDERYKP